MCVDFIQFQPIVIFSLFSTRFRSALLTFEEIRFELRSHVSAAFLVDFFFRQIRNFDLKVKIQTFNRTLPYGVSYLWIDNVKVRICSLNFFIWLVLMFELIIYWQIVITSIVPGKYSLYNCVSRRVIHLFIGSAVHRWRRCRSSLVAPSPLPLAPYDLSFTIPLPRMLSTSTIHCTLSSFRWWTHHW